MIIKYCILNSISGIIYVVFYKATVGTVGTV